jgi:hypothetical protein
MGPEDCSGFTTVNLAPWGSLPAESVLWQMQVKAAVC